MDRATPESSSFSTATTNQASSFDEEWEEWDGNSPFWVHCVAGSMAGVAEHVLVYPLDTVRTHIQVCAACNFNPLTHNASTQAATMAAGKEAVPGAILQQAAAANSPKLVVSKSIAASGKSSSSSSKTSRTTTTPKMGGWRGGGIFQSTAAGASNANNNLSMMQAVRQLVSQQPLALETAAAAATASNNNNNHSSLEQLKHAVSSKTKSTQLGLTRLWRGVQTILVGCIPAHALYFSTYEIVKAATLDSNGEVTAYGSALAGGCAVVSHDVILGPLDTVKQRLQLGHYKGLTDALTQMIRNEGVVSLARSFPITLATNIPYGMIMVGTNEVLKDQWTKIQSDNNTNTENNKHSELTLGVTLGASSVAGLIAAATTTPLDRIKTYLQTQQLAPSCLMQHHQLPCPYNGNSSSKAPIVANWKQAALRIYQQEGPAGFFKGVTPRILSHTPAVAISWTTYETLKRYLQQHFCNED